MAAISGVALSSSSDVLAIAVHEVGKLLNQRPVDDGLLNARLSELAAAVRRLGSRTTAGGALVECPTQLVATVPMMLGFLKHCFNRAADSEQMRTVENQVTNLCFQVIVWVRRFPAALAETLTANLPFLLHAARLQLTAINAGSVSVRGLPPIAHKVLTDATLSAHDDYLWLATVVMCKLEPPDLMAWLRRGADAPQSEAFLRVTHGTAVSALLFACLRTYEAVFRALALEPRPSFFPVPALRRNLASAEPTAPASFPNGLRRFFVRAVQTLVVLLQKGTPSASMWMDGLRVLSCTVHVLLLCELSQVPDSPESGHVFEDEAESVLARQDTASPRKLGRAASSSQQRSFSDAGSDGAAPRVAPELQAEDPFAATAGSLMKLHEAVAGLANAMLAVDDTHRYVEASASQLCKLAILLAAMEGVRHENNKPAAAALVRVSRELVAATKYIPSTTLRETVVLALSEVQTLQCACAAKYSPCVADLREPFMHCVDLFVDAHTPLQSDLATVAAGGAAPDRRSSHPQSQSSADRDDAWRSSLRSAMLFVEAHSTGGHARSAQAWWQLTMLFVRFVSGAQNDARAIPSANTVCGPPDATWNSYDEWVALRCAAQDDVASQRAAAAAAVTKDHEGRVYRKKRAPIADAAVEPHMLTASAKPTNELDQPSAVVQVALLCLDKLLGCIAAAGVALRDPHTGLTRTSSEPQDILAAAGEYCEALAAITESTDTPAAVVAHLLSGAHQCYRKADRVDDALRVGLSAQRSLVTVSCDLQAAGDLNADLGAYLMKRAAAVAR